MALVGFVAVIGLWLWSARGIVGNLGALIGFDTLKSMGSEKLGLVPTPTQAVIDASKIIVTVQAPDVIVNVPPQPTLAPLPTYTPYPTPAAVVGLPDVIMVYPAGSAAPADIDLGERVSVRVSHYWPPLGGINCDTLPDGSEECIHLADGSDFRDHVGRVVACPATWPFGTRVLVGGGWYECRDRGGAIVIEPDGTAWIDILYPYNPLGAWGSVYEAVIVYP